MGWLNDNLRFDRNSPLDVAIAIALVLICSAFGSLLAVLGIQATMAIADALKLDFSTFIGIIAWVILFLGGLYMFIHYGAQDLD